MSERREFFAAGAGLAASALLLAGSEAEAQTPVAGVAHRAVKKTPAGEVKLFLWRKRAADARRGTILFVHGSSISSTPVFDLQIPGRPEASTMAWFARLGYDTWCFDCEGYGRSDKSRPVNTC